jgi:hypothetical protein
MHSWWFTHGDFCGAVLGVMGAWPAGSKHARARYTGYCLWVLSDIFMVMFGIHIGSWSVLILNLLFVVTSTRGALNNRSLT